MEKALKMGKDSATGSFQLFIGKIVSTLILALGTIILGILLFEGEYGLYTVALIPATTIILFQDWGVNSAMTKYCAQYRAANKSGDLRKIIAAGLTFEVATGLALTVLSLSMAPFVASTIFGKPESAFLIILASTSILSSALLTASQSIFVGFERMDLNSITMICQAVAQCALAPLLVYLGYGALGAILGYTFASLAAGLIAVLLLFFIIFRNLSRDNESKYDISQTLKTLLHYGIPLAIAVILAGILTQFNSFMMASFCDIAMIGNYRIATNFAILSTFFTIPISTVLFPTFSKLDPRKESQLLKKVFTSSVKYTSFLLMPATMALMALSKPMISTLYGDKWLYAPFFLSLFLISNLFVVFGDTIFGTLLYALGETKTLMKLRILTLSIGIPLALLLIPQLGILGVIIVTIVAGVPSMFIGLYWTWKRYGVKADFRSSAKIFLASAIAAITTYILLNVLTATAWITFSTGLLIFLAIFLTTAPIIGAINQTDIINLRAMFSSIGIIFKVLAIPLLIVEKMLKTTQT